MAEKKESRKDEKTVVWRQIFTWRGNELVGAGEGDKKIQRDSFFLNKMSKNKNSNNLPDRITIRANRRGRRLE